MPDNKNLALLDEVARYYADKLALHGDTPQGVDWNGEASQALRFKQLFSLFNTEDSYSVNDLGCGYGAFFEFLTSTKTALASYQGIDVSADMINAAIRRYGDDHRAGFITANTPSRVATYSVASGIFNVKMERSDDEWFQYLVSTLDTLDRSCDTGFAFNCLTKYSDQDRMRSYLYYADPCSLFDLCKHRYSRQVALLHDYGLYEFTILVRKQP